MRKLIFIAFIIFLQSLAACAYSVKNLPQEKDIVAVPGGDFRMGMDEGEPDERPEHAVYVATFLIDKYETSAKDFAEFLNAKGNPDDKYFSHDKYSTIIGVSWVQGKEEETRKNPERYMPRKGYENFPANNVSWFGAYEYCKWKGKRLPTEAEWEKAARGNSRRIYPWGNSMPSSSKARYNQKWDEKGLDVMVPVDALPDGASRYKAFNMAGNVWEWVDDWLRRNYCSTCEKGRPCLPCRELDKCTICPDIVPKEGDFKVLRGGSWFDSFGEKVIRSTDRYWLEPEARYLHTGFRCAE